MESKSVLLPLALLCGLVISSGKIATEVVSSYGLTISDVVGNRSSESYIAFGFALCCISSIIVWVVNRGR